MTRRFFVFAFFASLIVLTSLFMRDIEQSVRQIQHIDKIGHFIAFFILSYISARAFRYPILLHIVTLTIYGGLVEVAQSQLSANRTGSWLDLLADFAGVCTFFLIWYFLQCKKRGPLSAKEQ